MTSQTIKTLLVRYNVPIERIDVVVQALGGVSSDDRGFSKAVISAIGEAGYIYADDGSGVYAKDLETGERMACLSAKRYLELPA